MWNIRQENFTTIPSDMSQNLESDKYISTIIIMNHHVVPVGRLIHAYHLVMLCHTNTRHLKATWSCVVAAFFAQSETEGINTSLCRGYSIRLLRGVR